MAQAFVELSRLTVVLSGAAETASGACSLNKPLFVSTLCSS